MTPVADNIVDSVKSGRCILFLGAMASAASPEEEHRYVYRDAPPGGGELSRRLALKFGYPDADVKNLQRVSLFAQFKKSSNRAEMVKAVAREIRRPTDESPDDFPMEPSPALQMLAGLPFRIVITTNYDQLFDTALRDARSLRRVRKTPLIRVCDISRNAPPEEVPDEFTEENPVLLKLHGDIDRPASVVITEEDYITFVQMMAHPQLHPIHEYIRVKIRAWPTLFIGYSLKDYNLRLLFRTLRWGMQDASIPLSFSVDPFPDDLVVAVWGEGNGKMVSFVKENLWKFVPELYRRVIGKDYEG